MTIERAIQKAQECGYMHPRWNIMQAIQDGSLAYFQDSVFLDPEFWKYLGKALGNKEEMRCESPLCDTVQCPYAGYKDPRGMFNDFTEIIWGGGKVEEYFESLK